MFRKMIPSSGQCLQHLGGIIGGFYLVEGLDDDSVLIDQIGCTEHSHGNLAVVLFLFPDIIGLDHFFFRIGQEGEGQPVFFLELLVRGQAVLAHTQVDRALFSELGIQLAKGTGLFCTAGSHVLRIKIQDHFLAQVIREASHLAILVGQGKFRCPGSDFQHILQPPFSVHFSLSQFSFPG